MPSPPLRTYTVIPSELQTLALTAAGKAYAPFSGFRVGCALRTLSGSLHLGCNVENSAYPLSGCAERHAIAAAVQAEGPQMQIAELLVVAIGPDGAVLDAAPCGGCRQQILEFGASAHICFRAGGEWQRASIGELLPHGFRFAPA